MRFHIEHRTWYRYSGPVFLEPQVIRLRPREDATQKLLSYSLQVSPSPAGHSCLLDLEGNNADLVWFDGQTELLEISVVFQVETLRSNPFDFIFPHTGDGLLPPPFTGETDAILKGYRNPGRSRTVKEFARQIAAEAGGQIHHFLTLLCRRIYDQSRIVIRLRGAPYPPGRTLSEQRGSCRDLAVLFIDACRHQGLPARFVSGYQAGDPDTKQRELHAWAEVYLPGGGWRGYDPTHGLVVSDGHVAVAACSQPATAAPLTGNFRGGGIRSRLFFDLKIEAC